MDIFDFVRESIILEEEDLLDEKKRLLLKFKKYMKDPLGGRRAKRSRQYVKNRLDRDAGVDSGARSLKFATGAHARAIKRKAVAGAALGAGGYGAYKLKKRGDK